MWLILADFLAGFTVGSLAALIEVADEAATARCATSAQFRVDQLRHDADDRLRDVYGRHEHWMGPATRDAYRRRLGG